MAKSSKDINICVIGASGYTGAELVRLLYNHPNANIKYLVADSNAGKTMGEIYKHLEFFNLPEVVKVEKVKWDDVDLAFCCLPHSTTQKVVKEIPKKVRVIDLSADFRLYDTKTYEKWYGTEHLAPELQKEAVYGLSELFRDPIKKARLVACPGCYPTSALLPLVPLLRRHMILHNPIIIDSKSGITGAGRGAKQESLFAEVNEGVRAYNIGAHRHAPEMEQILSAAGGDDVMVNFTPQIVPMNRGILSTIYVQLAKDVRTKDIRNTLQNRYEREQFINVLEKDEQPSTQSVKGTNQCLISVNKGRVSGMAIIVSVIDNLTKGASGQAVQNMNIMFDLPEKTGLDFIPVFP